MTSNSTMQLCPIGVFTFLIFLRYDARMRVISTVLCLFAAIIMMATPVMACCVNGHVENAPHSVQMTEAAAPPCHTVDTKLSSDADTQTPEKYCTSCDDCAVSSTFTVDTDPITKTHSDTSLVALVNAPHALPRPEMRLLRITGPPIEPASRFTDSPLARFDTLLI